MSEYLFLPLYRNISKPDFRKVRMLPAHPLLVLQGDLAKRRIEESRIGLDNDEAPGFLCEGKGQDTETTPDLHHIRLIAQIRMLQYLVENALVAQEDLAERLSLGELFVRRHEPLERPGRQGFTQLLCRTTTSQPSSAAAAAADGVRDPGSGNADSASGRSSSETVHESQASGARVLHHRRRRHRIEVASASSSAAVFVVAVFANVGPNQ